MSTKSNGANYGAVKKIGIRVGNAKPPKRAPYGYEYNSNGKLQLKVN